MKRYIFCYTGERAGYDISGNDLIELLDTCCQYCTTLSLRITGSEIIYAEGLEKFRIPKDDKITFVYEQYYPGMAAEEQPHVRYYRLCPELCDLLYKMADSIFEWINGFGFNNPEDPVFYRADGSLFFYSEIHEGECLLFPREGENVSRILSKEHWVEIDADGQPIGGSN